MPELPEVETVRRGLDAALQGARIKKVKLRRKDLRVPFQPKLAARLADRTIRKVRRRAKYLLFDLDSEEVLLAHLGMSGRFTVSAKPNSYGTHDHLVMELADGRYLIFNDPRRFGLMLLLEKDEEETHKLLVHLGPEPLSKAFSPAYLKEELSRRSGPVKPVLMNQELVVGVGNIYASEALYDAGINPQKPARQVAKHSEKLVLSIHKVLNSAIKSGGSSLRDFVNISGDSGYFQHDFQVYGRSKKPCRKCAAPIRLITQSGRSTFYCSKCQK